MKRRSLLFGATAITALVSAALSLPGQPPQPAQLTVSLTVLRHVDVANFNNAKVKTVLDAMGAVLKNIDPPADVSCDIAFTQKGNVGQFKGPNVILNAQQFNAVNNLGSAYHIKVVKTVDWCQVYMPSAVACSPMGIAGTSIIVEEDYFLNKGATLAGVICAHEYGHNRGLSHRNDRPTNLMNAGVSTSSLCINDTERLRYLVPPLSAAVSPAQILVTDDPDGPAGGPAAATVVEEPVKEEPKKVMHDQEALPPVKEFVRRVHLHGIPYATASRYTKDEDLAALLEMLKSPDDREWWPNVATTICFMGKASAVESLIGFVNGGPKLEATENPGQRAVTTARRAAVAHMGVIVNKTNDKTALDFITRLARLRPEAVAGFNWIPKEEGPALTSKDAIQGLAYAAVQGLAVSGNDNAAKTLDELGTNESPLPETILGAIGQAVKVNRNMKAKKIDLDAYFGRGH
jgi:hypothetical protein